MQDFTVLVECPSGDAMELNFNPIFSVRAMKHQVCSKLRILPEQTRLLLAKRVLVSVPSSRSSMNSSSSSAFDLGRCPPSAPAADMPLPDLPPDGRAPEKVVFTLLDEGMTLEEAKLNNQHIILEEKLQDGSWPKDKLRPGSSAKSSMGSFDDELPPLMENKESAGGLVDEEMDLLDRSHRLERKNSWDEIKTKGRKGPLTGGQSSIAGVPEDLQLEAAVLLSKEEAMSEAEKERRFEELMLSQGYLIRKINDDGNCLFGAVADQVYGDQTLHRDLRKMCLDYMEKDRDHFSQFLTEDFADYILRKRCLGVYGNNLEVQALSEMLARPIEVYSENAQPLNIFQGDYSARARPIRISYHRGNHYNSVVSLDAEPEETKGPTIADLQALLTGISTGPATTPTPTQSAPAVSDDDAGLHICFLCGQPCADYEDLQVHMFSVCEKKHLL